jgi:MoxR-like ATPase
LSITLPFSNLTYVADQKDIINIQNIFSSVKVNDAIKEYIIDIVEATKTNDRVSLGVSPRGALALMKASQAMAVLKGREFVLPDDVKHTAVPVLAHRLILKGHSMAIGSISPEAIIAGILETVPVPVEAINI